MAPPTVPTEVKRRRGTLRKDRTPTTTSTVAVQRASLDVDPPPTLGETGRIEWRHALSVCSWLAQSDLTALRFLCEAIDRREEFRKALEGKDVLLETSTGYAYVNPTIKSLEQTEDRIAKWMLQLGMTPSARGALGVAEVKQASKLDELAQRRKSRQAGLPASSPPSQPSQ